MNWHFHIEGQVQGVGFRPFVYRKAKERGLNGWVNNSCDGVHIMFTASEEEAMEFFKELLQKAPKLSRITKASSWKKPGEPFTEFRIIHSDSGGTPNLLVTPDFAMCADCRDELTDKGNRRYRYPFITCTNCGPRYSIIRSLPYDREHTEMDRFATCPECETEYYDPANRRYFSQTNSCPACAVTLTLYDRNRSIASQDQEEILRLTVEAWKAGKIVAIKGIGGYLLTCQASNASAIRNLRQRKHRPFKPFALMFPDLESLESMALVTPHEKSALDSVAAPILLLDAKEEAWHHLDMEGIAPGLSQIGCMLPYTPLYALLLHEMHEPIVATSGNITNSPIVFSDEKALGELSEIADLILLNNRDITVPQDDSVIRYAKTSEKRIMIRRSRGLAPTFLYTSIKDVKSSIIATGAMLKSTFCLLHQGNIYLSQYLGDLGHFDTQQSYRHVMQHFIRLLEIEPEMILHDRHPDYPSSHFARELANEWSAESRAYQHHVAHFAAVLGEHHLMDSQESVLGVIWDGTGLGTDGHIWGGEFFLYRDHQFERMTQFSYFDFILGDKMPKEPRISALSITRDVPGIKSFLETKFTESEWSLYQQVLEKESKLKSSSVGRIFDGVASLLGLRDKQTFEGEAAMLLEALARKYMEENGMHQTRSYLPVSMEWDHVPLNLILRNLHEDIRQGKPGGLIALNFHCTLAEAIWFIARKAGVSKIAFSGGVFQNALLVDLIHLHPNPEGFQFLFHRELSPNDECISFGQMICYLIDQKKSGVNSR